MTGAGTTQAILGRDPRDPVGESWCSETTPSEQGPLGRHPVAPWEALGARLELSKRLIVELLVLQSNGLQAELAQGHGRPAGAVGRIPGIVGGAGGGGGRGLGDDQPAPGLEEGSGALGGHGRTAEGTGEDDVEAVPEGGVTACHLRPVLAHGDPVLEAEPAHGVVQETGTAGVGVEEDHDGLGPAKGDDEAGEPAPRTEVQEDRRGGAVRPEAAGDDGEPVGVAELRVEGPGPRKPAARDSSRISRSPAGGGEAGREGSVRGTDVGQLAGAMTM
jgi:hypothetical protein